MCFSAGASFGASAILGAIGVVTIVKARTTPQRLFATFPCVFAVQQLAEGVLWLSLKDADLRTWEPFFTYTFLVFAMVIWPVWIPFTLRRLETDNRRKKVMGWLLSIGIMVSFGVGWVLLSYRVHVVPSHHHLHYSFDFPPVAKNILGPFTLLYCIATIIAPFISTIKRMKWLGIVFLTAWLFSITFYNGFVVSVWCYIAAVLSVVVLWIVGMRKAML